MLISFCSYGQELKGYVTQKGTFDYNDSTYAYTNISGIMLTFEGMKANSGDKEFIRIGALQSYGTTYHDYEVKRRTAPEEDGYTIVYMENPFEGKIVLKFGDDDFLLLFTLDEKFDNGESVWVNYYQGIFLNNKKD